MLHQMTIVWLPAVYISSLHGDAIASAVIAGLSTDPEISRFLKRFEPQDQDQREVVAASAEWEPHLT